MVIASSLGETEERPPVAGRAPGGPCAEPLGRAEGQASGPGGAFAAAG